MSIGDAAGRPDGPEQKSTSPGRLPPVTELLSLALSLSCINHAGLHEVWVRRSAKIGALLPGSLLMVQVQRIARLDLMLRSLELERDASATTATTADMLMLDQQMLLSEAWIGAVYEVLRLLMERQLVAQSEDFRSLAHDLRLLRIPLEKHEIAQDRKLKEPLQMSRGMATGGSGDRYDYVPGDKMKAHIMPSGLSRRGSASWVVIDVTAEQSAMQRWLERLELSDRFISLDVFQD